MTDAPHGVSQAAFGSSYKNVVYPKRGRNLDRDLPERTRNQRNSRILWDRIHLRSGRYIRYTFVVRTTAFANEFAPTETVFAVGKRCVWHTATRSLRQLL